MLGNVRSHKQQQPPSFRILCLVFAMMAFGVLAGTSLIILRTTQVENQELAQRLHKAGKCSTGLLCSMVHKLVAAASQGSGGTHTRPAAPPLHLCPLVHPPRCSAAPCLPPCMQRAARACCTGR